MGVFRVIFRDRSLGYKFALLSIVPSIIVTIFIVLVIINALERSIIEKTKLRVHGLTNLSVLSMSNSFVVYNKELLDNFVDSLAKEENIVYAMMVDSTDRRILAHSDHENDGKIFDDPATNKTPTTNQLPSQPMVTTRQGDIYELSAPVIIGGVKYGVVRLGFSLETVHKEIAGMKSGVITIAIIAILLGVFSSILLGRIISRPIRGLAEQAERIGEGNFERRMIYESNDALGQLATSFNKMAEELKRTVGVLEEDEAKYRALFEYSPISLWEEDLTQVKKYMDGLRDNGVKDFRKYFDDHPEEISPVINMIRILDVNESTLKLYEAEHKAGFLGSHRPIQTEESHRILIQGVIALAEGRPVEIETVYRTFTGRKITVLVKATIPPGYEKTWSKAFISVQDLTERARAEFLKKMFGRYLSEEVMNSMIENPDAIRLGGEKRNVTIMMTDLRGFTALSERLEPEQVVQMLNTYFEAMVDLAFHYSGTIIEIIGDALLVIFGAPQQMPDRAERAIACAIAMQNGMAEVNAQNRKLGLPELETGIGLNEAEVIVGNVGSIKRSKYGVVGSGVNLTGRIESYTVGGQILISESVRKEAGEVLQINQQLQIHPKGAETSLTIYEVGGIGGEYNLTLADRPPILVTLVREIPINYTMLDGKYMGEGVFAGTILRLARKSGEMRLQAEVEPLTNLKLNLVDVSEELSSKDFYGKVMKHSEKDTKVSVVHFTALPPGIDGYFQAAVGLGAQERRGS